MAQPARKQVSIHTHVHKRAKLLAQALGERTGRLITITEIMDRAVAALTEQYAQGNWLSPAERNLVAKLTTTPADTQPENA